MMRSWPATGVALLWLLTSIGLAAEPPSESGYVLLRDLAVLRGTVEEEPGRVIVRYRGGEVRLSREKVACWADSLDGLYQYQLDRRRIFTVESHLEAARWCLRHGLCDRAAAEIVAASRLRPDSPAIKRVEAELRVALDQQVANRMARSQETLAVTTSEVEPIESAVNAEEVDASELLKGIGPDQLREFNLRIQPLLANRCSAAACHGRGSSAAWVLESEPAPGRRPSAAMTRENLASVIRWINREQPAASPLLVRARQPHGGAEQPPLGPRDLVAVENLRRWIQSLQSNGLPLEAPTPQLAAREDPQGLAVETPRTSALGTAMGERNQPVRLPDVPDPFDPELFNRRFHPEAR